MATTNERATIERAGNTFQYQTAIGAVINRGAMVMLVAGAATSAGPSATGVCVGIANHSATKADGDDTIDTKFSTFSFKNSATDAIGDADIGGVCFVEDDETVSKSDNGGTLIKAGVIREIEGSSVWVCFA